MSYTVFKNNNKAITAPNESGEIVLDTSISKHIRITVYNNTYKFYDIVEKKYLTLSDIEDIDPGRCFFTAIIYPCGKKINPELEANETNYPILYKFVDVCLGSTFDHYPIASFNGKYSSSNNICFTYNNNAKLEFVFSDFIDVKIRLNLSPNGLNTDTTFSLTSDDVEIISLFQHNISIGAYDISDMGSYKIKYLFSFSFSFINNRYEGYDESVNGLSTKDKVLSMIQDLPPSKKYPASGLMYNGTYSNGESSMSISVYTIKYINNYNNTALDVISLLTGKKSGLSAATDVDSMNKSLYPNYSTVTIRSFADDVIRLS